MSLTKSAVLKIFRQVKPNATKLQADDFWGYVEASTSRARRNLLAALEKGGDSARSSVSAIVSAWLFQEFARGQHQHRQQPQHQRHHQQGHQQHQQQQSQQQQQKQHGGDDGDDQGWHQVHRGLRGPRAGRGEPPRVATSSSTTGKGRGEALPRAAAQDPAWARNGSGAKGGARTAAKRANSTRTPWASLLVSPQTPLLDSDGNVARKCSIGPDDGDVAMDRAHGYVMASSVTSSKLVCRLARRVCRDKPVVLVHQPMDDAGKDALREALRDWEDQLNSEGGSDNSTPHSFSLSDAAIVVCDPENNAQEPKNVILIHIDDHNTFLPGQAEAARHLNIEVAPELPCPEDLDDELAVTVVKHMCNDAGLEEWASDFFELKDRRDIVKAIQKLVRSGKPDPELKVRIMADRTYKYKGNMIENAKVRAVITVPKHEVDELLARSGQYGVLYEYPDRPRNAGFKKVNLPLQWDLNDCNTAVAAVEADVRRRILGLVPTTRGFAARVRHEDEAQVTRALVPEVAEQLGDSLGLRPNSRWLLRDLPRRITKADIIRMLATNSGHWCSWQVLPKYAIIDRNVRGASWVVEAEEPPPVKTFRTRGQCVTIERHIDEKTLSPANRVWAKPIAQWERARSATATSPNIRKPWCDMDDDDDDIDIDCEGNDFSTQADPAATPTQPTYTETTQQDDGSRTQQRRPQQGPFPTLPNPSHPSQMAENAVVTPWQRRPKSFRLTDSSGNDSAGPPRAKKRFGEQRSTEPHWPPLAAAQVDHEKEAMRAALQAKDEQIQNLQNSMVQLQRMMEQLMTAMAANGTISTQAAAATLAEVQQAAEAGPNAGHGAHNEQQSMWQRPSAPHDHHGAHDDDA